MELYNDTDRPALDIGVTKRLARLDKDLAVTWSKWEINPLTSRPLLHKGEPMPSIGYHLWVHNSNGRWYYINSFPYFGHREVAMLERDPARRMSPQEMLNRKRAWMRDQQKKAQRDHWQDKEDIRQANKSRIHDLVFEGKGGKRQAKMASYPGQTNRSTPGDIEMDNKEAGWDVPEPK